MNCEKKNFLVLKLLQTCIFKYSFVCVKKKLIMFQVLKKTPSM